MGICVTFCKKLDHDTYGVLYHWCPNQEGVHIEAGEQLDGECLCTCSCKQEGGVPEYVTVVVPPGVSLAEAIRAALAERNYA